MSFSQREIMRRLGINRRTVIRLGRSDEPPQPPGISAVAFVLAALFIFVGGRLFVTLAQRMEGQAQNTRDLLARELGKLASAEVGRSVAAAAPLTIQQLGS